MYFVLLILVTTGLVAVAAFFSVIGIASMFAYNYVPALIMGSTLEAGKIVIAIYLYRYWRLIPSAFKSLLVAFLAMLMFITSVGVFGYLSQGYQKTSEEYKLITAELGDLESEYAGKKAREQDVNRHIDELPDNHVTSKIRLSREFGDELAEIRDRLSVIEPRIQELRLKRLSYETHIGPIAYVARMFDVAQDTLVFYAILLLVIVADPLAVTLTVACNMALIRFWSHNRSRSPALGLARIIDSLAERARNVALAAHGAALSAPSTRAEQPATRTSRTAARRFAGAKANAAGRNANRGTRA